MATVLHAEERPEMSDLYETDVLAWSEQQSALLQSVARGERVDELVDWPNLIEEIEAMGRAELRACESLLRQALLHLLKLHMWPDLAAAHWRGEVYGFLTAAQDRFSPTMRQRIDLEKLYERAARQMRIGTDDPDSLRRMPVLCPYTLDDFLAAPSDPASLLGRLDQATPA